MSFNIFSIPNSGRGDNYVRFCESIIRDFLQIGFYTYEINIGKECICCIDFRYCHDRMRACGSRETVVRPLILTYNTNIKSKIHYHDL